VFAFQGDFLTLFQSVPQPGDPGDGELWDDHVMATADVNAACVGFFRRLQHAYLNRMLVRAHASDPDHDHALEPPPKKRRGDEVYDDKRLENEDWHLQQLEEMQLAATAEAVATAAAGQRGSASWRAALRSSRADGIAGRARPALA
jgi:hypothetical protein